MDKLLDLEAAAVVIGMSREWLRKQVTAELVPCTRFGRAVRFTTEQIAEIVAAHAQPTAPVYMALRTAPRPTPVPGRSVRSEPRFTLVDGSGPSYPPTTPPPPPRPTSPPKAAPDAKARTA